MASKLREIVERCALDSPGPRVPSPDRKDFAERVARAVLEEACGMFDGYGIVPGRDPSYYKGALRRHFGLEDEE